MISFTETISISFPAISALKSPNTDLFKNSSVFMVILPSDFILPVLLTSTADIFIPFPAIIPVWLLPNDARVSLDRYTLGTRTFTPLTSSSTYHIISLLRLFICSFVRAVPIDRLKSSIAVMELSNNICICSFSFAAPFRYLFPVLSRIALFTTLDS